MSYASKYVAALILLLSLSTVQAGEPPARAASSNTLSPIQFVDLLWVKPEASPDDAVRYFKQVLPPVMAKHGGRVIHVYRIDEALRGDLRPAVTASLSFPSMQALQAMFKDPDYQKIVPERDAIFDFTQQSLFRVTAM